MDMAIDNDCKLVTCLMPDNGTDLALLKALRDEKGIVSANSARCYSSAILADAKTKKDKLPEPVLARMVIIVVPAAAADDVFDFVCRTANIDVLGGGVVCKGPMTFANHYSLPENVPEEAT